MTDKELRKLSRLELLEILLEQSKENEQLRLENETLRQENELLQNNSRVGVDEDVLKDFSRVAAMIESSLGETRKVTKDYITHLTHLAHSVQSNIAAAKINEPERAVRREVAEAPQIAVTPVKAPAQTPVTVVKVTHLPRKQSAAQPDPATESDRRFIKELVDFYFANVNLLDLLTPELKREFINRFKR